MKVRMTVTIIREFEPEAANYGVGEGELTLDRVEQIDEDSAGEIAEFAIEEGEFTVTFEEV